MSLVAVNAKEEEHSPSPHQHSEYINEEHSSNTKYIPPVAEMQNTQGFQKYTCPMHPQIIQDNPGKCPLCGMT
ncbi:heavy metal-binding domain-containing protein, partial [Acinetobacter baumannii]